MHFSCIVFFIVALFLTDTVGGSDEYCLIANHQNGRNEEIRCNECNTKCGEYNENHHSSRILKFGETMLCDCSISPELNDCIMPEGTQQINPRSQCFTRYTTYWNGTQRRWISIGGMCLYITHGNINRFECKCYPDPLTK